MVKLNVRELPVAANVCEQVLREVERQPSWSMAHVIMNPLAQSLLHKHEKMTEIYVITRGYGELGLAIPESNICYQPVVAGSVHVIPPGCPHMLRNKSGGHLEHLVFAFPPFDPTDVVLLEGHPDEKVGALRLPQVQDCFDGAKIMPYAFPNLDVSIAFGWAINDPTRHKKPHYHKKTTEFISVVGGQGRIQIDRLPQPIKSHDWLRIDPGTEHGLLNESPEDLVVVCVCSPAFDMEDVHYR